MSTSSLPESRQCRRHLRIKRSNAPAATTAPLLCCESDASFGFTAAVAEAMVQSHAGEISLLPALPDGWEDGSVSGLRARGGYEVSMQWRGGKMQTADIHSFKGGAIKVRSGAKTATITIKPGQMVHLNADLVAANQ